MYEDDFNDPESLSVLDFVKISFGTDKFKRIRFGIVAVFVMILAYLAVGVFYNNRKANYTSDFKYQIPSLIQKKNTDGDIVSVSYLDGSPFNANSLITLENLNNVKKTNDEFSNIDVEKMFEQNDVSIEFDGKEEYQYSLSIKEKYFKNEEQAKIFFDSLVSLPLNETAELVESTNNSFYLKQAINRDLTFIQEIKYLITQADYIINSYNTLINNMNSSDYQYVKNKVVVNGDDLTELIVLKNDAQSKIDNLRLNELIIEAQDRHYVRDYSKQEIKNKILNIYQNLLAEQQELQAKIDNYNTMIQSGTMLNANYNNYVYCLDRKVEVDKDVLVYKGYIDNGVESLDFEKKLENIVTTLNEITNEFTAVQKDTYQEKYNVVFYKNNSKIVETGHVRTLIAIAVAFVAGLVFAAIINIILGYSKYKTMKLNSKIEKKENQNNLETKNS